MGESRKHRSVWDRVEEPRHADRKSEHRSWTGKRNHTSDDGGRYYEHVVSGTARKSVDHSGWSSWELLEEDPVAEMGDSFNRNRQDILEITGMSRRTSSYKNVSPGRHNHAHSSENDWSHSRRYPGRGRSRSASRVRGRSRSRSRSWSRDRRRERGRALSRSRSRSRSDGARGLQTGSRSPIQDHRQTYGWSDRRSGQEKSSQVCRDFPSGRCRRGGECRFLHPGSRKEGGFVEDDRGENWRKGRDHAPVLRDSNDRGPASRSRDDSYPRDDEHFRTRHRSTIPCKDFLKGNCRWGDTCRFLHHVDPSDNYGRRSRNESSGKEMDDQASKNGNPPCKFFAAGNCHRDNCRFSHECPKPSNREGRRDEDSYKTKWNGPTWDDSEKTSDTVKPSGWGETTINRNNAADTPHEDAYKTKWNGPTWTDSERTSDTVKHSGRCGTITNIISAADTLDEDSYKSKWSGPTWNDSERTSDTVKLSGWGGTSTNMNSATDSAEVKPVDTWEDTFGNENNAWRIADRVEKSSMKDEQLSPPGGTGGYDGKEGNFDSMDEKIINNKQEPDNFLGSRSLSQDVSHVHGDGIGTKAIQQNFFSDSHIQQQHSMLVEENFVNSPGSDTLEKVKASMSTTHHVPLVETAVNESGKIMLHGFSDEMDRMSPTLPSNRSNEHLFNLNRHEPNVQTETQTYQNNVNKAETSEVEIPRFIPNSVTSEQAAKISIPSTAISAEQVTPLTTLTALLPQIFLNGQIQSQLHGGLDSLNSAGMMPATSVAASQVPLVDAVNVQIADPRTRSVNLFNPMGAGMEAQATRPMNMSNTLGNDADFTNSDCHNLAPTILSHSTEDKSQIHVEPTNSSSPRLDQQEISANAEVTEGKKSIAKEAKSLEEQKPAEIMEDQGKTEKGSSNKDEKVMRLFKNALVEFVKEILKPTWKEGQMSRDVHKIIVKKVVDKVTSTIQSDHIPKTQDKVEQYLSHCKPKIIKLVQAYVERSLKTDS